MIRRLILPFFLSGIPLEQANCLAHRREAVIYEPAPIHEQSRLLAYTRCSFALIGVFQIALNDKRIRMFSSRFAKCSEVGHIIAIQLIMVVKDLMFRLQPVLVVTIGRSTLRFPDFIGAISNAIEDTLCLIAARVGR